ncbi:MAG TPA: hypothetical protein VG347_05920 [Verrucomicrobiae bacterium]|nr:hypothetical protein [Verrucomicrobiae bacterium]
MRALLNPFVWLMFLLPVVASAQIDPVKRDLIQMGYNQPIEGQAPVAGYAYYYHNEPDFIRTNMTWRLALAPVYLDTELGFINGLGPQTDFAIGAAGGGFADSYNEMRGGSFIKEESFEGDGGELNASVYHLFNPSQRIPLSYVFHAGAHYTTYSHEDETAANFQAPDDGVNFSVRTGLRWGGIEPTLFPDLAMELAVWYEGQFRTDGGDYGYIDGSHGPAGVRHLESASHLFWGSAALSYTFPESKQNIFVRLIAATSIDADRMSAYRLGGFLPLIAEYPLSLPGYYYQEFSARQFALINASYLLPLTKDRRWNLEVNAATALIDYLPGTQQPGDSLSGVGAGILYHSPSDKYKVIVSYEYGIDAIRDHGRGANSISFLLQIDLEKIVGHDFSVAHPGQWNGWQHIFSR